MSAQANAGARVLSGRVALVTGGGRGIGFAIARALYDAGAAVVVADNGTDIAGNGADPTVARDAAKALGNNALPFEESVASPSAARAAVELATRQFGGLDILVNNAAILRDGFVFKYEPADWEAVIRNNLSAAFYAINAATPLLRDQARAERGGKPYRWGRIVNIVSTAGFYGNFGQAAYASAKAGLFGLTRVTAMDMARSLVTCNAVAPFAHTRVTETIQPANPAQAAYKERALKIDPAPVGELVRRLCTPEGDEITGQLLGVRGRELFVFSQPRPVARSVDGDIAELKRDFTPLQTDLEAFNTDPVV
ncbi:MAG: SDR family NAD(P)-dependent oxidoreductase [Alphaproteobacteria bacterium]|nr:SDR family NAD(P)-dependent oxidoreductase [Alphaproteobacteria bacterium]